MLYALLLLAALSPASAQLSVSTVPITVIYPPEGFSMPMGPGQWIIGSVSDPKAKFSINGFPVKPYHRDGGFIGYLPVVPGTFTFHCELYLPGTTAYFTRNIQVTPSSITFSPGKAQIDAASLQPSEDVELRPGDWLTVRMRATPGMKAEFQVLNQSKRWPMAEASRNQGLFEGAYQIQPGDAMDASAIRFYLKPSQGWGRPATADSKGKVSVRTGPPVVAMVTGEGIINLKSGPNEGYLLFPPPGTKLLVSGRLGGDTRVQLSSNLSGWLSSSAISILPAGTPPPRAILGTIRTQSDGDATSVFLGLAETIPFSIEENSALDQLTIRLYGALEHSNWIVYDHQDDFVHLVRWKQENSDTLAVTVQLAPHRKIWGYRAWWENGSLRVALRHPPRLPEKGSALQGRTIVLDPGHMPSAPGAAGPRGSLEKDVNLAIAKALDAMLKRAGAHPIMTRTGDDEVSLVERPRVATAARADIFVSVHNNNIADGENPFDSPHGHSIFYYHPQSLALAQAVHQAYRRLIPLPDENLRYGNLLVARNSDMPAILVESAYMTYPDQEDLLNTPSFQDRLAGAMFEGIRNFFEAERRRQQAEPAAGIGSSLKSIVSVNGAGTGEEINAPPAAPPQLPAGKAEKTKSKRKSRKTKGKK